GAPGLQGLQIEGYTGQAGLFGIGLRIHTGRQGLARPTLLANSGDSGDAAAGADRSGDSTLHGALRSGAGDRAMDTAEVRESGDLYYDQDGNQVYVQHLPEGRTNVTIVNPATGQDITSYETSTARVSERVAKGELWKLNE